MQNGAADIEQKENERLVIGSANAVVNPIAVMVVADNALVAIPAVVRA